MKKDSKKMQINAKNTVRTVENSSEMRRQIADWHSWACEMAKFPIGSGAATKLSHTENGRHITRLLVRMLAVMIMRRTGLVPESIFNPDCLDGILMRFNLNSAESGDYYNAILQNLFFAAFGRKPEERSFTDGRNSSLEYGINTMFRDDSRKTFFRINYNEFIEIFKEVPCMIGGLFECQDYFEGKAANIKAYSDGFSRESARRAFVPNVLFFQKCKDGHEGIINILERYFPLFEEKPVNPSLIEEKLKTAIDAIPQDYSPTEQDSKELFALVDLVLKTEKAGTEGQNHVRPAFIALKPEENVNPSRPSDGRSIQAYNKAARLKAELSVVHDKIRTARNSWQSRHFRIRHSQLMYSMQISN